MRSHPTGLDRVDLAWRRLRLTRIRSATAGEGECELKCSCFHELKRGIEAASGWLHRLVRRNAWNHSVATPAPTLTYHQPAARLRVPRTE